MRLIKYCIFLFVLLPVLHAEEPPIVEATKAETVRVRPLTWAQPVLGTELENFYKLDDKLYRSEQPGDDEMEALEAFGVKSVLNLRDHHDDEDEAEDTKLKLYRVEMNAGSITREQLIQALRYIHEAPKPVVVHCWHGSDRTGCVCAAYRIVFQGWSKKDAIDELRHGGYGFHATFYENIPRLLADLDVAAIKAAVLKTEPDGAADSSKKETAAKKPEVKEAEAAPVTDAAAE